MYRYSQILLPWVLERWLCMSLAQILRIPFKANLKGQTNEQNMRVAASANYRGLRFCSLDLNLA